MVGCHSDPDASGSESLTIFMAAATLEGIASPDFVGIAMTGLGITLINGRKPPPAQTMIPE